MAKSCKEVKPICDKYLEKTAVLNPVTSQLKADKIFELMMQIKNGLCMTENPSSFTNKIVPTQDPLVKLRQNAGNELEVVYPLPIAKANVLNPSMTDEIRTVLMASNERLPQSDIAFKDIDMEAACNVAKNTSPSSNYVYKIIIADLAVDKNFAVNPMQVGRLFPGMFTVYCDGVSVC